MGVALHGVNISPRYELPYAASAAGADCHRHSKRHELSITAVSCRLLQPVVQRYFLQIKDETETIINVLHLVYRNPADPFRQERFVQRDNLGNVGHRILWKLGAPLRQEHVTGGNLKAQIGGQHSNDNRVDTAIVEIVALNDEHGAAVAWLRTGRRSKCRPPDIAALDHHSSPGMDAACAFSTAESMDEFSDAYTWSNFSFTPA